MESLPASAVDLPVRESRTSRRRWLTAAWAALPLVAFGLAVLTVPSVRSFAEDVLVRFRDFFFNRAPAVERELGTWDALGGETQIVESESELASAAGFAARTLPVAPDVPRFTSALAVTGDRSALIASYRGGTWLALVLQQTLADAREYGALAFPLGMPGVSDGADIRRVEVGGYVGEQVHGSWVGASDDYRWRDDWPVNRVRWSDGALVYTVELRPYIAPGDRIEMPTRREMSRVALRLARLLME